MRRWLLLLAMLACCGGALAQSLDILTTRHRTAEQLLPQLRPLLEPGATLTGTGNKLFLRASERNRAEIRQVLAALDQAPRRLMISVRQGGELAEQGGGAEAAGRVGTDGAAVGVRVYSSRSTRDGNVLQQVQTIEGGRAFINVGQSVPLRLQQVVATPAGVIVSRNVVFREIGTGFHVEPQLAGDTVTLEIMPTHDTPGATPGSAHVERLYTTVSGRIGEWITVGGTVQDTSSDQEGTLRYGTRNVRESRQVWLKVEELK